MNMLNIRAVMLAVFVLTVAGSAQAHEIKVGDIQIIHPWARASAGPSRAGAAYFSISNDGASADRLISAATPMAKKAQLHTHIMDAGVMKMRHVKGIEIAPGDTAALEPGGAHVMLMGLRGPLKEGEPFPLTLTFEKAGSIEITVEVQGVADKKMKHD